MDTPENKKVQIVKDWLGSGSINLFGRPFSGKDTQASRLAQILGAEIIGGGDIIRNNPSAREISDYVSSGRLAPQEAYLNLVLPYLSKPEYRGSPLVLSSLGRWSGEEQPILQATKESGHPIMAVVCLDIPEEEVMKRWELAKKIADRGNRNDDNPTSIMTRLQEYKDKTIPVLDNYNQAGLLITVDGTKSAENVATTILNSLLALAKRKPE